jgi:GNAT superfamily N-acetyltransferase
MGLVPATQTLKNLRAYPVEEEVTAVLKDQRAALLRPAMASDANGIRELFHSMSETDVFTRFFHQVRQLSSQDVQRLCNVNFDNEVAFVAVTGPREDPRIVAHACYFLDYSTNLAETAFIVRPDWQGCGLGGALQERLAGHAKSRGVRGFVAEILHSNTHMIRLAQSGSKNASVESGADSVRVTTLF